MMSCLLSMILVSVILIHILDTYKRYVKEVDKVDGLVDKVAVIEITVEKHSEQIVSLQHRFA